MKNSMSSFSGLALSRSEMKSVTGGWCGVQLIGGGCMRVASYADAQAGAALVGGHYCCASCGSTSTWNSSNCK